MNTTARMARRVSEQMERDFGPAPVPGCEDTAARVSVEGGNLAAALPRVPSGVNWSPTSDAFEQAEGTNDIYLAAWRETQGGERYLAVNDNFRLGERKGDWMQTATGRKFWPLDPRHEEVDIHDIAHALSMLCRYGGHCQRFYSVAEHSVIMARWVAACGTPQEALWALLHDASEAYIADVPRPLKRHLDGYKDAEAAVMAAVCDKFGLPHEMPAIVHEADNRILADEIRQNMRPMAWHDKHDDPLGESLKFWSPELAKEAFLMEFDELWKMAWRAAA